MPRNVCGVTRAGGDIEDKSFRETPLDEPKEVAL